MLFKMDTVRTSAKKCSQSRVVLKNAGRGYKWGLIRQVAVYSIHPLESQRKGLRNDRDQL